MNSLQHKRAWSQSDTTGLDILKAAVRYSVDRDGWDGETILSRQPKNKGRISPAQPQPNVFRLASLCDSAQSPTHEVPLGLMIEESCVFDPTVSVGGWVNFAHEKRALEGTWDKDIVRRLWRLFKQGLRAFCGLRAKG